jgi:GNAT superfamily N-acetyltransferase
MTISVRRASAEDESGMSGALGRAFADDPVFDWLVPDPTKRHQMLPAWFLLGFRKLFKRREVYTTDELAGAAVWAAPDEWKSKTSEMLSVVPGSIRVVGLGPLRRLIATFNAIEKQHPDEPHWYLELLGTDPPHQRKGIGAALMKPVLDRCDAEGLPAYLETQKERNVPYYRHHGFEVRKEIDLPGGGPHMWLMWREPLG